MNRLANETSPYLRQHADNPVDWYPWGDEAFERARAEGKPIFLSVGYSTCHWCHVMAHESFEDPAIAEQMNAAFVNIKVDREERPDIDSVYMAYTQALTGHGGWPMTVFLTPELKPFYAGTYFPPDDQRGMPGLPRILNSITSAWTADRGRVLESAATITTRMRDAAERAAPRAVAIADDVTARVVDALTEMYDHDAGGFGGAPKFPPVSTLEFLLTYQKHTEAPDQRAAILEMVTHTLRQMAAGGIYDHLAGGFARYSVDGQWLVPHFEKMLYDNALLAKVYLHAFQVTRAPEFERVARETLDYLLREMHDAAGGFHAAQDADSEGIEGKFFVWIVAEIDDVLGAADGALFRAVFDVSADGNFEDSHHPELTGRNVLSRPYSLEVIAADRGMRIEELAAQVEGMRARMFAAREQRVRPSKDDKVLTSWNGLALSAFAEAARILDDPRYREAALGCARFLRTTMWDGTRLLHAYRDGQGHVDGLIDDYAMLGLGLVDLYRATGDLAHLEWAAALLEGAVSRFHDDAAGGFFEAPVSDDLVLRQKPFFDAPTPSGNGALALLATWLGRYYGRPDWEALGGEVIALVADQLVRAPTGFATTLQALEVARAPRRELAVVGAPEARAPFEREVALHFLPLTLYAPASSGAGLPILEARGVTGGAAAYVCEEMVCELPARTVEVLRDQLAQ